MEDVNRLIGGLNTDHNPSTQPEHTLRHCLNFTPVTENGDIYELSNEDGTKLLSDIVFPESFKLIGYSILNSEILVVLASDDGYSQVGYISEGVTQHEVYKNYHPVAPIDPVTKEVSTSNSEFEFSVNHPVDCVSRKLINGNRILYFTDNNIPFGRVNFDNPPEIGSVSEVSTLKFTQKIPKIEITAISENVSSSIRPGVYQFVTRYITDNGGVTTTGIPSNPLPMTPKSRRGGVNAYCGAFYEDEIINKNVNLKFSNIDENYKELEIIAIYYQGSESVFKANTVANLSITGSELEYTFTGVDTESSVEITREGIIKQDISYTKAKCIEQKDNVLFLSNLTSGTVDDDLLQEVANSIQVSYRIHELQYSGRGENPTINSISFNPTSSPYLTTPYTLILPMSQEVDPTSVSDLTDFALAKEGVTASGNFTIDDTTAIVDGDTFLVDTSGAIGLQSSVTYTAKATPTLENEFEIHPTDNSITAANLTDAINSSSETIEFYATTDNNIINIIWLTIESESNNVVLTVSGSGVSATNLSGATISPSKENPTEITVNGLNVELRFDNNVTTGDLLEILGELKQLGEDNTYTTGTSNSLPIVSESPSEDSSQIQAGFTDYLNEIATVEAKGYRRGEVYSLSFCLLFKDGTTSNAFHIPGDKNYGIGLGKNEPNDTLWPSFSLSSNSTGRLGTYVSELPYSADQNYPGNEEGDDNSSSGVAGFERNIRHHYIPELKNEPHFRIDGDNTFIRVLGLEFEFMKELPQSILDDVEDIIFLREERNNDINKSIIAQGLINRSGIYADQYNGDGNVGGSNQVGGSTFLNAKSGYYSSEIPFGNNGSNYEKHIYIPGNIDGALNEHPLEGSSFKGTAQPGQPSYGNSYSDGKRLRTDLNNKQVFFHSPESNLTSIYSFDANDISLSEIRPEMLMRGSYKRVNLGQDTWEYEMGSLFTTQTYFMKKYAFTDYFFNYNDYYTNLPGGAKVNIIDARICEAGVDRYSPLDPNEPTMRTSTRWTQGGLELLLDSNLIDDGSPQFTTQSEIYLPYEPVQSRDDSDGTTTCTWVKKTPSSGGEAISDLAFRHLYNLRIDNSAQYQQIDNAEYIIIDRISAFELNGDFKTNYNDVFGGDTFITKYAFNTGQLTPYFPLTVEGGRNGVNSSRESNSQRGYTHFDGIEKGYQGGVNKACGWDFRCVTSYFVESSINTYYRHQPVGEEKQNYYPNESNLATLLWNYFPNLGNVRAYNSQYSYDNNIKTFYPRGSNSQIINEFENRTIYSEVAANDDTLDSYRSFLQNNYYDLPSNTGPIWDTFVHNNTLFMHTPKSLWKTFAETAATLQGENISDVVLGTGNLFARPSQEIITSKGGYAGTISQFGGVHTGIGYIFPDVLQGKVFGLVRGDGGEYLKDFSALGMSTFFHQNLGLGLIKNQDGSFDTSKVTTVNSHEIDNPYNKIGIGGGYDSKLNKFILVKFENEQSEGFTISFSTALDVWSSFHSYVPNSIITFDNRLLFSNFEIGQLKFWEMNKGVKSSFFDEVYNSELELVSTSPEVKVFQNVVISSESEDVPNQVKVKDDNFETFQVLNDRCNSSELKLKVDSSFNPSKNADEVLVKYKNDEFRLAIPRDSVIDNSGNILKESNLDITAKFRERIKGEYARLVFKYNNSKGFRFKVNSIKTIFNINRR